MFSVVSWLRYYFVNFSPSPFFGCKVTSLFSPYFSCIHGEESSNAMAFSGSLWSINVSPGPLPFMQTKRSNINFKLLVRAYLSMGLLIAHASAISGLAYRSRFHLRSFSAHAFFYKNCTAKRIDLLKSTRMHYSFERVHDYIHSPGLHSLSPNPAAVFSHAKHKHPLFGSYAGTIIFSSVGAWDHQKKSDGPL